MAKTKVWFLETHAPLFHPSGKNLGTKIFPDRVGSGCEAWHDSETREIQVTHNDLNKSGGGKPITTNLGIATYAQWTPYQDVKEVVNEHKTEDKSKRSSAQAATPQSHVFEGRGQGKTGRG